MPEAAYLMFTGIARPRPVECAVSAIRPAMVRAFGRGYGTPVAMHHTVSDRSVRFHRSAGQTGAGIIGRCGSISARADDSRIRIGGIGRATFATGCKKCGECEYDNKL